MKDDYHIHKDGRIMTGKKHTKKSKVVSHVNKLKKNHSPVVLHKNERVIQKDQDKLNKLEKKYKVSLYPKKFV